MCMRARERAALERGPSRASPWRGRKRLLRGRGPPFAPATASGPPDAHDRDRVLPDIGPPGLDWSAERTPAAARGPGDRSPQYRASEVSYRITGLGCAVLAGGVRGGQRGPPRGVSRAERAKASAAARRGGDLF